MTQPRGKEPSELLLYVMASVRRDGEALLADHAVKTNPYFIAEVESFVLQMSELEEDVIAYGVTEEYKSRSYNLMAIMEDIWQRYAVH